MIEPNNRPLIMSTRGMITTGHYLATAAGHRIALQGGNAVDIAAAACFCLNLLENHQCGLGGEVPILVYSAQEKEVYAISGVGWNAAEFTIAWCRANQLDMIPGDGFLPALAPAVVGTWGAALERFGTLGFAQVLQPAIELAEQGFPMYASLQATILANREKFTRLYPTTGQVYLPDGRLPEIGARLRNPDFAKTLKTLVKAEAGMAHKGRAAGIRAAVQAFYQGAIAEQIDRFIHDHPVMDGSGIRHAGLLTYADLAGWEARIEKPLSLDFHGLTVYKCPAWTQGPVFLQQLAILEGIDLAAMGLNSPDYIHTLVEAAKLAFSDREAYYGDPLFDPAPFDVLLSPAYNDSRRALIGESASLELRPGDAGHGIPTFPWWDVRTSNRQALGLDNPRSMPRHAHDTTHLDVADQEGNLVSATPSGGWMPSSPVIPGLGFPLGTRGQMFYLDPRRPNGLAPHKRPRATLTPTLVTRDREPWLAFGMRGGDVQDQKTLQFFLAHTLFGLDVQSALDVPTFHSEAFPSSFTPHNGEPGRLVVEGRLGRAVIAALEAHGHRVEVVNNIHENTMAIRVDRKTGVFSGGVCSTAECAYALGL